MEGAFQGDFLSVQKSRELRQYMGRRCLSYCELPHFRPLCFPWLPGKPGVKGRPIPLFHCHSCKGLWNRQATSQDSTQNAAIFNRNRDHKPVNSSLDTRPIRPQPQQLKLAPNTRTSIPSRHQSPSSTPPPHPTSYSTAAPSTSPTLPKQPQTSTLQESSPHRAYKAAHATSAKSTG